MGFSAADPLTLVELVERSAERQPSAPALVAPERTPLPHAELLRQLRETGAALRGAGIERHHRVALVLDNGPEAASGFLGTAAAAVCAPLNPAYREAELDWFLGDLDPRLVIVGAGTAGPVRAVAAARGIDVVELVPGPVAGRFTLDGLTPGGEIPAGADPDDVALVLHTSGTTSRPKLVPLTHANLCASAGNVASVLSLTASDRCLNVMPLFHIHGLVAALLASLRAGGSVICTPGFHAVRVFAWARALEPTWTTAVPTMLQAILARISTDADARSALSGLRLVRSSSAALPAPVFEGLEEALGVPVLEAYGMTEAAHQMASNRLPPALRRAGSVGSAAGPEIAVLDETGTRLSAGAVGEVAIRGANVFSGYVGAPEANAAAFTGGWFRTGDEGWLDADGDLHLSGRLKEIINRGGEKIAPAEIDDVLLRHPAVAQAVTFAIPEPRLGEEVGAAVVLVEDQEADERALQDFVSQTVAPFKVPRTIVVVDEIPKGPTGKLQRIGLHERLGVSAGKPADARVDGARSLTYVESLIARVWADVLGLDSIGVDDDFFVLGGDSILGAEAVARVRDLTGRIDLPLVSIVRAPTVASFARELGHGVERGDACLVPITSDGDGLPLHLVHGVDGDVFGFAALARRLGGTRPVFGLRAAGLEGEDPPYRSVEEMAQAYVAELVVAQPCGPYLVGGVCAGGPVAIEIARLLRNAGEQVERIVLIDPRMRAPRTPGWYAWRLRVALRRHALGELLASRLAAALTPRRDELPARTATVETRIAAMRDAYVLRPLAVDAILLTSDDYDARGVPATTWVRALGDVDRRRFAGSHRHLFLPPVVDALAAELRSALEGTP